MFGIENRPSFHSVTRGRWGERTAWERSFVTRAPRYASTRIGVGPEASCTSSFSMRNGARRKKLVRAWARERSRCTGSPRHERHIPGHCASTRGLFSGWGQSSWGSSDGQTGKRDANGTERQDETEGTHVWTHEPPRGFTLCRTIFAPSRRRGEINANCAQDSRWLNRRRLRLVRCVTAPSRNRQS